MKPDFPDISLTTLLAGLIAMAIIASGLWFGGQAWAARDAAQKRSSAAPVVAPPPTPKPASGGGR